MLTIQNRITHVLLALVLVALLAIIAMLASGVRGGPLDPADPPGSTMKSLDHVSASWSRALPADDGATGPDPPAGCDSSRFDCLEDFFNAAVLDRETGLVWHRDATSAAVTWGAICTPTRMNTVAGFRHAWRLPTYEEFQSLLQHFAGPPPLPPGNPFVVSTDDFYWTATTPTDAVAVAVRFDTIFGTIANEPKTNTNYAWCVRSGTGTVRVP